MRLDEYRYITLADIFLYTVGKRGQKQCLPEASVPPKRYDAVGMYRIPVPEKPDSGSFFKFGSGSGIFVTGFCRFLHFFCNICLDY